MIENKVKTNFFNSNGKVYASLTQDGILLKNEKEKDRLNIMDKKGYAIDISLLNKAIESGAEQLEIKETTLAGSQRVYRILLTDIQKHSRHVTLAGIPRYAFSLSWCDLISGIPEKWQVAEHSRWLMSQVDSTKKTKPPVQGSLFGNGTLSEAAQRERMMAR